jgi:hypothetical protein
MRDDLQMKHRRRLMGIVVGANSVRPINGGRPIKGAEGMRNEQNTLAEQGTRRVPLRMAPRSLRAFIAGFKASVTSQVGRELNAVNIWQRNYYEHIIRNENELKNI